MRLRTIGFAVTIAAVLLLIGSLISGLRLSSAEIPFESVSANRLSPPAERIRVEVLNGAGVAGLARRVTEQLRDAGFDVVHYGNAGTLARDSTTILDRSGNVAAVRKLAEAIEIERIETAIDTTLYLEATLILGPDWDGALPGS